jgi:hypothetical protein
MDAREQTIESNIINIIILTTIIITINIIIINYSSCAFSHRVSVS